MAGWSTRDFTKFFTKQFGCQPRLAWGFVPSRKIVEPPQHAEQFAEVLQSRATEPAIDIRTLMSPWLCGLGQGP
jgi:hypothetical protein